MKIFEVGPRDGLQNEKKILKLEQKFKLVISLLDAGLTDVEVGSFVKKTAIPQLAGTAELVKKILPLKKKRWPKARLWAFVPNEIGLENALASGVEGFSFFAATSETFARKNVNRSHKELKKHLKAMSLGVPRKARSRAYLSTLVYCPFEGKISPSQVFRWVDYLLDIGIKDISLSDTTGHAHPSNLKKIFRELTKNYSPDNFSLHYHDTRGTALLNTYFAMEHGFTQFDSSLGGAGGCPYAPGATGNLATEDLLYLLQSQSKLTNISLRKIAQASLELEKNLNKKLPSKILQTLRTR
ncbi:MAG: hydroxymethylglutaryl-CoA lyase [Bdellovibrionota bacterium]